MEKNKSFLYNNNESVRLDVFLTAQFSNFTRSYIKTLIEDNLITVNGKVVKSGYSLKHGDEICVNLPELKTISAKPEDIQLNIVYEDDSIIIINKQYIFERKNFYDQKVLFAGFSADFSCYCRIAQRLLSC